MELILSLRENEIKQNLILRLLHTDFDPEKGLLIATVEADVRHVNLMWFFGHANSQVFVKDGDDTTVYMSCRLRAITGITEVKATLKICYSNSR